MSAANRYDVIIIGSGYGGLLPAWRLARAGAQVLLIERGRRWDPKDFRQSWDPRYLVDVYDVAYSDTLTEIYRVSRVLGGGSVMNSMMHQRTPSEGFDFEDPETGRRAWPAGVNRAALDPYYAQVEELLSIRQLDFFEVPMIGANFGRMFRDAGLSCDPGRFNMGPGCVRKGFCEAGCTSVGGKITLLLRTLSEALETGNLTIEEDLTASRVLPFGGGYRVECVRSGKSLRSQQPDRSFEAPRVILAAGPLGTVPLLMRSGRELRNLSRALGRWVNNNGDVNFVFETPEHYPDHSGYKSSNNSGMISYAFWDRHRVTMHPGFSPVPVMAGIDVHFKGKLSWGLEHKHYVKDHVIHRLIPVNAMRQIPSDLRMAIDGNGLARIHNSPEPARRAHGEYMLALAERVARGCGGKVLRTSSSPTLLDMGGNHIMGGARMSDDPATGVVGPDGEIHGHRGLYVSDASAIPSTLGINPALTIGANALRIADGIARSLQ